MTDEIPDATISTLARSIYKEASSYGFQQLDIVRLINQLMDLCTASDNAVIGESGVEVGMKFLSEDALTELPIKGDRVVVQWKMSGTHEGEFRGVAPTGKPFTVHGFNIWRISGGKIVGRRSVWDMLGLFEQVGAFP